MADHFYSVVKGDGLSPGNVTFGTSTSAEAIELRVVDGAGISKTDLMIALKAIQNYIVQASAPA
jgi:hypothetical protein